MTATIGLDWGTTSLRAYRLGADGTVLERREAASGILSVDPGEFPDAFAAIAGDWSAEAPDATIVLSGMVGSRQGWVEAPYADCPADVANLANAAIPVPLGDGFGERSGWIVPGLSTRNGGMPDVMRGEETQILGALADLLDQGGDRHRVCLPGTHSKWVSVDGGRVTGFQTHMTGEVFDVLRRHSILGRMIEHSAWDHGSFQDGVRRAAAPGGLLAHLFGVRASGLFGDLNDLTAGPFLSGLLIGHELAQAPLEEGGAPVVLIGDRTLAGLYADALAVRGLHSTLVEGEPAARGLAMISARLKDRAGA